MKQASYAVYARPRDAEPPTLGALSRDQFIRLLRQLRAYLPHRVSKSALHTFELMAASTRPSDWTTPGREPCCYRPQVEIAEIAGCSPGRIRAHEAELVEAGLIEKRTMGNGARSGWKGRGIFFTPAIERLQEFEELAASRAAEREMSARLRGLRSTHKKHLKSALDALAAYLGAEHPRVQGFRDILATWPTADALHRMTLAALEAHEAAADGLCREALQLLQNVEDSHGRPPENERSHIQDTTQRPTQVICNASVHEMPSGKPDDTNQQDDAPTGASCPEKNDEAAREAHKSEFLEKLTPERLYRLASEEMQLHLDVRRYRHGNLAAHDFVVAAQDRCHELGINISAWNQAVAAMGEEKATMAVLVLDASRDRPGMPVRNPGGYLRGMARAAERGELNLIGSLIGLSERRRQD